MILSLGSNYGKKENMAEAIRRLRDSFPDLHFSEPVLTEPIGFNDSAEWFLNCVAVGRTEEGYEVVKHRLKMIEQNLGRSPEEKAVGHISIDIDLLQWNDEILKPADLARDYVTNSITSLLPFQKKT